MNLQALWKFPIIQGPMAGGGSTPALAAAVSNAGGLGSLGCGMLSPDAIAQQVAELRKLSDRPFVLNLFIQDRPSPTADEIVRGTQLLRPVFEGLGWDSLPLPSSWCEDFAAQLDTLIALKPAVGSFTFGILNEVQIERLHDAGIIVIGTATTVDEAQAWEAVGADAVIASGIESGGHRGTFMGPQEAANLPARELWSAAADEVRIPLIAAGGIMTGVDINEALRLGACAVQMGTAFLVCDESGINPAYRHALVNAGGIDTRLTRAFTGRYARGLVNGFMRRMQAVESQVPNYPVQNALTAGIRKAAGQSGDTDNMSLWAGAEVRRARPMPCAQLMQTLVAEMRTQ
ncbi:NAD(P)H-dependent flavin oxidoreductase [Massilia glaciei]|uniref:Nitronate monooxygenase n=1 Tax=Massilia glaciei TaxID=1524097 RepID=A0A2U2I759_9BURK|nr:nitronate monooxygenase [Massilia glaciei]PWF55604.1 2-nitropropane dioxygenase [Massilia glaciei]